MPELSPRPTGSSTARWIAAARAREAARADRLFEDPYATTLAGEDGWAILAASERASGQENDFLPIRTRFFDELLIGEARSGDQVVLPGAGLDTRAFRLPLPPGIVWFEIDSPSLLEDKDRVLAAMGGRPRCDRRPVAADLAGRWDAALLRADFRPGSRTLWVAEGLLFYLPPSAVAELLRTARRLSGAGSLFAADIFGSGLHRLAGMRPYLEGLSERGLPPPFVTDDPVALFADAGWTSVEVADPGQLARTYGRSSGATVAPVDLADPSMRTHLVVARAVS